MYMSSASQPFFKPSKFPENRFRCIGYTTHVARIAGVPVLSDQSAMFVTKLLVSMRHTFTRNSTILFDQGLLELTCRKTSYRGAIPAKWCTNSKPLTLDFSLVESFRNMYNAVMHTHDCVSHLFLACPNCKQFKDCIHLPMVNGTRWSPIRCTNRQCSRTAASSRWNCICAKPWFACDIHAAIGHDIPPKISNKNQSKRCRSDSAPDQEDPAPTDPGRRSRSRVSVTLPEQVPTDRDDQTEMINSTKHSVSANSQAPGDAVPSGLHFSNLSSISLSSKDEHSPVTLKCKWESEHHQSLT